MSFYNKRNSQLQNYLVLNLCGNKSQSGLLWSFVQDWQCACNSWGFEFTSCFVVATRGCELAMCACRVSRKAIKVFGLLVPESQCRWIALYLLFEALFKFRKDISAVAENILIVCFQDCFHSELDLSFFLVRSLENNRKNPPLSPPSLLCHCPDGCNPHFEK